MAERTIYLKIEPIDDYSPVEPDEKAPPPIEYKRDCMRNVGHQDGKIPTSERNARALTALVYREYLDPGYILPKIEKLIRNDINEPVYNHRVPGTVIYGRVGDILHIEVLNCDTEPHSWHIHGVDYGINSDGAWPFGVQGADGRRSDEICPGSKWTYTIRLAEDSVGCWPFHSHTRNTGISIKRGLFGGLVVLPKRVFFPPDFMIPPILANLPKDLAVRERRGIPNAAVLSRGGKQYLHDQLDFLKEWTEAQNYAETHLLLDEAANLELAKILNSQGSDKDSGIDLSNGNEVECALDELDKKTKIKSVSEAIVKEKRVEATALIPLFRPIHAPIFFHVMIDPKADPVFDSGDIEELVGVFEHTFAIAGNFDYFCQFHPNMTGSVQVVAGGPAMATVSIIDGPPMGFSPNIITVGIGGTLRWENTSILHHTVTSVDGGAMQSHCLNGRAFAGNSPTIVCYSGQTILWHVFNLDFGHEFHNFHPHAMRWKNGEENQDTRSLSPAESFCVKTKIPQVVLLTGDVLELQKTWPKPAKAKLYLVKGDFIFHCHVHHHMMNGMIGIVRARQFIWLTDSMKAELEANTNLLPYDGSNACPQIDIIRCLKGGEGSWEEIPGNPEVAMMHSMPLPNTNKMLYWGYTNIEQSRLFDWTTDTYSKPANQPASLPGHDQNTSNLWSSEHTFLNDATGTLLAHGGLSGAGGKKSFLFDPLTEIWTATADTTDARFYSTSLTLSDGRALTLYGSASKSIEVYDPAVGTWSTPIVMPPAMNHHVYYPWTYLLPDGKLFIAGPHDPTHRFDWNNAAATLETFPTINGNRSTGGEKGSATMLILRPPDYQVRVIIAGGNTPSTESTAEIIDLSQPVPSWTALPNLNVVRPFQVQTTLLPDDRIALAGGATPGPDGGPIELYDPKNPASGWVQGPFMKYVRGYHSSMVMMPDGSLICGGDPQVGGIPTNHERYKPGYFNVARPTILNAPTTINHGVVFTIDTPDANNIAEVILMYPGAVTHGFNMTQRGVECVVNVPTPNTLEVTAPPNANIAPPGWWIVFILDGNRIPSVGRWIRLT